VNVNSAHQSQENRRKCYPTVETPKSGINSVIYMKMQKGGKKDRIKYTVNVWKVSARLFLILLRQGFTTRGWRIEIQMLSKKDSS
jgi:hypothetical protein